MKKIVLTFGLIAGGILSAMLLVTLPFHEQIGFDNGALIGYSTMVLAFLLIFFGVRSYRDNIAGGTVRFGRAFLVGALISFVASTCYVVTWEAIYFKFGGEFITKYQDHVLAKARAQGDDAATLAKKQAAMEDFAKMYDNPVYNAAFTFLEPMPVALIVALVSAGVLSRKKPGVPAGA